MNKYYIKDYEEGGKRYYLIHKKEFPTLAIEEKILAELIYTLFAEGTEAMMQFLRKEGILEDS